MLAHLQGPFWKLYLLEHGAQMKLDTDDKHSHNAAEYNERIQVCKY